MSTDKTRAHYEAMAVEAAGTAPTISLQTKIRRAANTCHAHGLVATADNLVSAHSLTAELVFQLRGCRDMLRESAKQHRLNGDIGHANMADLKANDATAALARIGSAP